MINFLTQKAGLTIHQSNMSRLLKRGKITYKKGTKRFTELDKEKTKQFVDDNYWLLFSNYTYAVDEYGFNLGGVSHYAYAF